MTKSRRHRETWSVPSARMVRYGCELTWCPTAVFTALLVVVGAYAAAPKMSRDLPEVRASAVFRGRAGSVISSISWSSTGRFLASAGFESGIEIRDAETGQLLRTLEPFDDHKRSGSRRSMRRDCCFLARGSDSGGRYIRGNGRALGGRGLEENRDPVRFHAGQQSCLVTRSADVGGGLLRQESPPLGHRRRQGQ